MRRKSSDTEHMIDMLCMSLALAVSMLRGKDAPESFEHLSAALEDGCPSEEVLKAFMADAAGKGHLKGY